MKPQGRLVLTIAELKVLLAHGMLGHLAAHRDNSGAARADLANQVLWHLGPVHNLGRNRD